MLISLDSPAYGNAGVPVPMLHGIHLSNASIAFGEVYRSTSIANVCVFVCGVDELLPVCNFEKPGLDLGEVLEVRTPLSF